MSMDQQSQSIECLINSSDVLKVFFYFYSIPLLFTNQKKRIRFEQMGNPTDRIHQSREWVGDP